MVHELSHKVFNMIPELLHNYLMWYIRHFFRYFWRAKMVSTATNNKNKNLKWYMNYCIRYFLVPIFFLSNMVPKLLRYYLIRYINHFSCLIGIYVWQVFEYLLLNKLWATHYVIFQSNCHSLFSNVY